MVAAGFGTNVVSGSYVSGIVNAAGAHHDYLRDSTKANVKLSAARPRSTIAAAANHQRRHRLGVRYQRDPDRASRSAAAAGLWWRRMLAQVAAEQLQIN